VSVAHGQNKFKLKPEAAGKLCLSCHPDFEDKAEARVRSHPREDG
jgi:hypothetical protein